MIERDEKKADCCISGCGGFHQRSAVGDKLYRFHDFLRKPRQMKQSNICMK